MQYIILPIGRQINIIVRTINFVLGEFSSAVTIARPKSTSLRTTIPEGIAKLIDLKAGDELRWIVTLKAKGIDVTVSKKSR